jgi:hypothetical protein
MAPSWTSDEELFARASRELFSAVIRDTLDRLGRRHQFLPPEIQPLRSPKWGPVDTLNAPPW